MRSNVVSDISGNFQSNLSLPPQPKARTSTMRSPQHAKAFGWILGIGLLPHPVSRTRCRPNNDNESFSLLHDSLLCRHPLCQLRRVEVVSSYPLGCRLRKLRSP